MNKFVGLVILISGLVGTAFAQQAKGQQLTAPAFQGVLPMGGRLMGLFRVPSSTSQWSGGIGEKIPGSTWTLRSLSMRPTSAVIELPNGTRVPLAPGETYLGGKAGVPAPVEKSAVASPPARRPVVRRQAQVLNLSNYDPRQAQAEPEEKIIPGPPPQVVDASGQRPTNFESFAVPGLPTVVMVTSQVCPGCQGITPHVFQWAKRHGDYRVVMA
jgi:hypothetical protein